MPELKPGDPIPQHLAALIPGFEDYKAPPPPPPKPTPAPVPKNKEVAMQMIEAQKAVPTAKVAINGIFKHPPEFTEEEWGIIVQGLKTGLPLYSIASRVHCERHFLARKIAEVEEVAQVALDAREMQLDIAEMQLNKAIMTGSLAAIMYFLDHHGQKRGYGEQQEKHSDAEDVHITFGEISQADIAEGNRIVAEAQKKVTPTLAGELAAMEEKGIPIPSSASPQDLAAAEDMLKAINASMPSPLPSSAPTIDVTPQGSASPPPYVSQQDAQKEAHYDFLENAFSEGGESPFGAF